MKTRTLQIKIDFLFVVFCTSDLSTLLDANKCRHFGAYLTHPHPLSFSKERGDMYYSTHHYFPPL
jgi:hypothetical protein